MLPAVLVLGFVLELALRLWLSHRVPTPVAHADEDRYLILARAIAGGPGGLGGDTEAFRRVGYPLLLAPIYGYVQDPFKVYDAAQTLGAIVNALAFPLAYVFARRVLGARTWLSAAMAFAAAILPAVVYFSQFALTDVLFAPIGLAWLLLLHGWLVGRTDGGRFAAALGAGAVVGYAYATHVRGLVLLAIHIGVLAVVLWARHGRPWRAAAGSLLMALLVTRLDWFVQRTMGDSVVKGGIEPGDRMLSALTSAKGLVHTLCDAAGQFWYMSVATAGLAAVGIVVVVETVRAHGDFAKRTVFGALMASTVFIAVASVSALPPDTRVSNHAYFRYIAFLAPIWVMIGILALAEADRRAKRRLLASAAAVMGGTLLVVMTRMAPREWFHPFDSPEISFLTGTWDSFRPFKATLVALVLLSVWLLRRWLVPVAVATGFSLLALVVINIKAVRPMVAAEYLPGSRLVHDLGISPADRVQSARQVDLSSKVNHQREVYWTTVPEFDALVESPDPSTTVVIAPWHPKVRMVCKTDKTAECLYVHWDGARQGWYRVYTYDNAGRHWALWRRR